MKGLRASAVAVSVVALSLAGPTVKAKDKTPGSITVAFGAGLNTAQPGNTPNHHVIPQEFTVKITKAKKLDGTVVFVPGNPSRRHPVWVDRQGGEQAIPAGAHNFVPQSARLSPDGSRFLAPIFDPSGMADNIWIYDLARGAITRVTFEVSNPHGVWTPDGKRVIYWSATGNAVV